MFPSHDRTGAAVPVTPAPPSSPVIKPVAPPVEEVEVIGKRPANDQNWNQPWSPTNLWRWSWATGIFYSPKVGTPTIPDDVYEDLEREYVREQDQIHPIEPGYEEEWRPAPKGESIPDYSDYPLDEYSYIGRNPVPEYEQEEYEMWRDMYEQHNIWHPDAYRNVVENPPMDRDWETL